ncbi:4Fe-4S dicluster domain-containing protein [Sphingomonas sp.]|uniref:4Fe-4S dicluster domain-containing protein n=1 Tax=Sphingomonas sp. TaxID=28214 RepID=UPI001EC396AF|nr:4Fe-4S dicluster domain-containing protein [Sphingomonas sp.]MBX3593781.1 4Fe-4S dicluster domain-containing protein [Sphingomonas sp.]
MPVSQIRGCIGCGNCVKACPPDVLRLDAATGKAFIAYPDDCQICHLCRLSCPVDAIELTPDQHVPPIVSWG